MKNPREIFKNKQFLLDEPEVEQLLEYCEQMQDQIIDFRFDKNENKQLIMLDMIKEIVKGCNEAEKQQKEFLRFGLDAPDFEEAISNLKKYILVQCRDNKIYL